MELKKTATVQVDLQAEFTRIPRKQADLATAKCFGDFLYSLTLPGAVKLNQAEICFFVDESGSMSCDCGGITRKQAVHQAIQAILPNLPAGISISMTAFATDSHVVIPTQALTEANRQQLILAVTNAPRPEIGCGTAIHANVVGKVTTLRDEEAATRGRKQVFIVVLSDGQDNSGAMPWTDAVAKSGEMTLGLKNIAAINAQTLKRRNCAVQLAFIGVSKDACWNVIQALNKAEGLNTMGGVVNQDGRYLAELLEFFVGRFLHTAYLQTDLQIETSPPLDCRILDSELPTQEGKREPESYGVSYITTSWHRGRTQRHLGTLAAGQNLGLIIQVRWPLDAEAKVDLSEVKVTATLTGQQPPTLAGNEYNIG